MFEIQQDAFIRECGKRKVYRGVVLYSASSRESRNAPRTKNVLVIMFDESAGDKAIIGSCSGVSSAASNDYSSDASSTTVMSETMEAVYTSRMLG